MAFIRTSVFDRANLLQEFCNIIPATTYMYTILIVPLDEMNVYDGVFPYVVNFHIFQSFHADFTYTC